MDDEDRFAQNVGFIYRTMVERDPNKRRVKPVEKNLHLMDFGDMDDSSDDSDFKLGDDQGDSDNDKTTEESETDESESEQEDAKDSKDFFAKLENIEHKQKIPKLSVGELIERAKQRQCEARQRINSDSAVSARKLRVLICSVCLGDVSEENDEIVECDSCGVSVHEGCYGITDADTIMSTTSSCSTEPWFCDACKAGNTSPICELCPNTGGIFKETDVGKWVHLVCALYIPGVAFGDVDKLSPVTLFEMPYTRWGAKACCLCEDDRFSRTGVCACCDAGMCRSYFHITCAQREGLLSEASTEQDIADPFFAYCKVHADKNVMRIKRRNWLALQSQIKEKQLLEKGTPEDQARIERKLAWHRQRYLLHKAEKPTPWVPTQKMPRLLTSSPSACRKLIKKAELLGINPQNHISDVDSIIDIRKKWHLPPAFSVEFISYYLDRNSRMVSMQRRLDELLIQNSQLQEQEQCLRVKYEKLLYELEIMKSKNASLQDRGNDLSRIIVNMGNKKFQLPEVFRPKPAIKSPSRKRSDANLIFECGICHKNNDQHQLAKCDTCQRHYHLGCLDPPLSRMPKKTKSQGWECSECDKTEEEEKRDNVDPDAPRKLRDHENPGRFTIQRALRQRMYQSQLNKAAAQGVVAGGGGEDTSSVTTEETSLSANKNDDNKEESAVEDDSDSARDKDDKNDKKNSKRSKRSPIPKKKKRSTSSASRSSNTTNTSVASGNGTGNGSNKTATKRKMTSASEAEEEVPTKTCRHQALRNAGERDNGAECNRCKEAAAGNGQSVRCDVCMKYYHFKCLSPPVKKTPKQRGYSWFCEDCDNLSSEDEDTEQLTFKQPRRSKLRKSDENKAAAGKT